MRDECHAWRDLFCRGLSALGLDYPLPEGAFYAFVPMKTAFSQHIIDAGVVIVPCLAIGIKAPEFARMSYATSRKNLGRALDRIKKVIGK